MSPPAITFAQLCERFLAAGIHVGVDLAGDRHAILLEDPSDGRAIRFPVDRDFDAAATCLVLSASLREHLGDTSDFEGRSGLVSIGRWPEFLALWAVVT